MKKDNKRDIEFLFELGSLNNVQRGWRQHLGMDCASIPEHTIRVIWLALIIARKEGIKNEEKIIKMALVHDVAETRTTDLSYIQKVYVDANEDSSAKDLFSETQVQDFYNDILREFESRKSLEAGYLK